MSRRFLLPLEVWPQLQYHANYCHIVNSDNFAKDQDEGLQMLPVDLYLSEEVNLNGILEFTNDVMSKPDFVQKFYENPEGILKKYGIEEFDKDSPQIQIILAGADPDVLKAIKDNNFKAYLQILEEKNYLQSDFIQQMNRMVDNDFLKTKAYEEVRTNFVLTIPVAIAAAVVVVVAAAVSVAAWAHIAAMTDLFIRAASSDGELLLEDDALTLYVDKSKSLDTIDINEEEYVSEIRKIILNAEVSNDPETNNKLFQVACGTAEHKIENSK